MNRTRTFLLAAGIALLSACSSTGEPPARAGVASLAGTYYDALRGNAALADVGMQPDVGFRSPRFTLASEPALRQALAGLVPQVRQLEIRHQVVDGDTVLTFYQLDLGSPDGPFPVAERLTFEDGRLADVQLIFDSVRLPAPPGS